MTELNLAEYISVLTLETLPAVVKRVTYDFARGGSSHYRIVDQADGFPFELGLNGRQFSTDAFLPRTLAR